MSLDKTGKDQAGKDTTGKKKEKKTGKSRAGAFFTAFLKTIVIVCGILVLALAAVFARNLYRVSQEKSTEKVTDDSVFTDTQTDDLITADVTESSPTDTSEASTEDQTDYGISILVLNGTNTAGAAGAVRTKLEDAGFTSVSVGDYNPVDGATVPTTRILTKSGQSADGLKAYLADATVEEGTVDSSLTIGEDGGPANTEGADIIVLVGENETTGE